MSVISERLPPETPQYLGLEEVQGIMAEQVSGNFHALAAALVEKDYARIGVVSKEDFYEVLTANTIRLSPEQVCARVFSFFI